MRRKPMRAILAMTVALTLVTGQLQADPPKAPPAQVFGALQNRTMESNLVDNAN